MNRCEKCGSAMAQSQRTGKLYCREKCWLNKNNGGESHAGYRTSLGSGMKNQGNEGSSRDRYIFVETVIKAVLGVFAVASEAAYSKSGNQGIEELMALARVEIGRIVESTSKFIPDDGPFGVREL